MLKDEPNEDEAETPFTESREFDRVCGQPTMPYRIILFFEWNLHCFLHFLQVRKNLKMFSSKQFKFRNKIFFSLNFVPFLDPTVGNCFILSSVCVLKFNQLKIQKPTKNKPKNNKKHTKRQQMGHPGPPHRPSCRQSFWVQKHGWWVGTLATGESVSEVVFFNFFN